MTLQNKHIHDTVHRYNMNINYIRTDNCRFCASEKKSGYGEYAGLLNSYEMEGDELNYDFKQYWRNIVVDNLLLDGYDIGNINDFIIHKTNNKNVKTTKLNTDEKCAICLIEFKKEGVRLSNCNHIFHNDCLNEWLHYNNNCPLCRTSI
jgi:hypothetical protein